VMDVENGFLRAVEYFLAGLVSGAVLNSIMSVGNPALAGYGSAVKTLVSLISFFSALALAKKMKYWRTHYLAGFAAGTLLFSSVTMDWIMLMVSITALATILRRCGS